MTIVKEEKETFWGRVKSRFGKIWSWMSSKFLSGWKSFTSLFSGNKSKATVVAESSNVITPTEGQVEAVQQQVSTEPNMETPPQQPEGEAPKSVNPPATHEIAEEAEKGELEKDGNNGSPELPTGNRKEKPLVAKEPAKTEDGNKGNPNPEQTGTKSGPQGKPDLPKKPVPANGKKKPKLGFIKVDDDGNLQLVVHKSYKSCIEDTAEPFLGYWIYGMIGGKAYCVTGNPCSTTMGEDESFSVTSMREQGAKNTAECCDIPKIVSKLGLGDTIKSVWITHISDVVITPKVKSPIANVNTPFTETAAPNPQQVVGNGLYAPKVGGSK